MLDELRSFLELKMKRCSEKNETYEMLFIMEQAFGACDFTLTKTKNPEIVSLWEDEYKPKFESLIRTRKEIKDV